MLSMEQVDWKCVVEPGVFWFWNETPTVDNIHVWIDNFKHVGFTHVYVHAMPTSFRTNHFYAGMDLPYLGGDYFEFIKITCDAIQEHGLRMWIYDEGGWPSGMAGGQVVEANPSYGIWTMTPNGPRQHLDEAPYIDLMNAEATHQFIASTHERYRSAIGDAFGKTVLGVFTDEPRIQGCVGTSQIPWSPQLPAYYQEQFDESLDVIMPELFSCNPKHFESQKRYIRAVSGLVSKAYYKQIRQWCERYGLLFEGHHSGESEFGKHYEYFGDYLEQARHYHVPGVDAIMRHVFPGRSSNYVSLAASSAWSRNLPCAMTECFNVYGSGLTLAQMQWVAAYHLVRGVNKIGVMPALLSAVDDRKLSSCQDISPRDPRWGDLDLLIGYIRRIAHFTLQGSPRPTVGVLYQPENAISDDSLSDMYEKVCNQIGDSLCSFVFISKFERKLPHELQCLVDMSAQAEDPQLRRLRGIDIFSHEAIASFMQFSLYKPLSKSEGVRILPLTGDRLLLFNQNMHKVTLRFSCKTKLKEVVLEDGPGLWLRPIRQTNQVCAVELMPGQMRAFEPGNEEGQIWLLDSCEDLDEDWSVAISEFYDLGDDILKEAVLPLEWEKRCLGDYSCQDSFFSGSLLYRRTIVFDNDSQRRVTLHLSGVFEVAQVIVNDISVGRRAWEPYEYDLTDHLKHGVNEIVIRVTNTLSNQWRKLITKDGCRSNPYLGIVTPFLEENRRAGLAGPVELKFWCREPQV